MALPMRLAPFTGVYGLSFVFALFGTAIAWIALRRPRMALFAAGFSAVAGRFARTSGPQAPAIESLLPFSQMSLSATTGRRPEAQQLHQKLEILTLQAGLTAATSRTSSFGRRCRRRFTTSKTPQLRDRLRNVARFVKAPLIIGTVGQNDKKALSELGDSDLSDGRIARVDTTRSFWFRSASLFPSLLKAWSARSLRKSETSRPASVSRHSLSASRSSGRLSATSRRFRIWSGNSRRRGFGACEPDERRLFRHDSRARAAYEPRSHAGGRESPLDPSIHQRWLDRLDRSCGPGDPDAEADGRDVRSPAVLVCERNDSLFAVSATSSLGFALVAAGLFLVYSQLPSFSRGG